MQSTLQLSQVAVWQNLPAKTGERNQISKAAMLGIMTNASYVLCESKDENFKQHFFAWDNHLNYFNMPTGWQCAYINRPGSPETDSRIYFNFLKINLMLQYLLVQWYALLILVSISKENGIIEDSNITNSLRIVIKPIASRT